MGCGASSQPTMSNDMMSALTSQVQQMQANAMQQQQQMAANDPEYRELLNRQEDLQKQYLEARSQNDQQRINAVQMELMTLAQHPKIMQYNLQLTQAMSQQQQHPQNLRFGNQTQMQQPIMFQTQSKTETRRVGRNTFTTTTMNYNTTQQNGLNNNDNTLGNMMGMMSNTNYVDAASNITRTTHTPSAPPSVVISNTNDHGNNDNYGVTANTSSEPLVGGSIFDQLNHS